MFGSHVTRHPSYISIEIKHGACKHGEHDDWYSGRKHILRLRMTAAQFAGMLVNVGVGDGVPCTLEYIEGEGALPKPPRVPLEADRIRRGFRKKCEELDSSLAGHYKSVGEILMKRSLTQTDKREVLQAFSKISQEIRSNMPFVLELFEESAEKVVTASKAEVESFVSLMLRAAGMEAMQKRLEGQTDAPTLLPEGPK